MLNTLRSKFLLQNGGLYRDYGLGIFHSCDGHILDKYGKQLTTTLSQLGLKYTDAINISKAGFSDPSLELNVLSLKPPQNPK